MAIKTGVAYFIFSLSLAFYLSGEIELTAGYKDRSCLLYCFSRFLSFSTQIIYVSVCLIKIARSLKKVFEKPYFKFQKLTNWSSLCDIIIIIQDLFLFKTHFKNLLKNLQAENLNYAYAKFKLKFTVYELNTSGSEWAIIVTGENIIWHFRKLFMLVWR